MADSFLRKIVKSKQQEAERAKKRTSLEDLMKVVLGLPPVRNFRDVLYRPQGKTLIAEVKLKMPSVRAFKPKLKLAELVLAYEQGGARAISVVTDNKFFGGKLALIGEIKKMTALPILCKDFIVDPYQVYEARAAKADALLLIAAIIPEKALPKLVNLTTGLGMVPVVEIHTQPELKRALKAGADVILINNRDLTTMKLNFQTVSRLIKLVPKDIAVIAASGYKQAEELTEITSDRLRAFLLGRVLLESKTPDKLLHDMNEVLLKS
jgi:indole-3-glycerol phosphate synthase